MILNLIQHHGCKSVLCLNGTLPDKTFFDALHLPIYAADGAANQLINLNISPKLIIGDLDSVDKHIKDQYPCLHLPHQDQCDFEKSIDYLSENELIPALVVGSGGGFLDHILHNINVFSKINALLYAPPIAGWMLKKGTHMILAYPDAKISIMGMPSATVSSKNLKWELSAHQLIIGGMQSSFNRATDSMVELCVHDGQALVMIYLESMHDAGVLPVDLL